MFSYEPADRRIETRQIVAGWLICVGLFAITFGSAPAGENVTRGIHVVEAAFVTAVPESVAQGCLSSPT